MTTAVKKSPFLALLPFWGFVFLFKFAAGLHYTLLPVLGERVLPIWIVGILVGVASFCQLMLDVPAGFLLDRFGYVRLLRMGTFVFLAAALVLCLPFTLWTYLTTLFLSFIGWLFFNPGINAYTLGAASSDEGGRYMGTQHAVASFGIVCAATLLVLIIHSRVVLIGFVLAMIFAGAILSLQAAREDKASIAEIRKKHVRHSYYIRRSFLPTIIKALKRLDPPAAILMLQNLSGAIFYAVVWFVVPLVIVAQASSGALGIGLSIFDLAVVVLGAFLGRLADRYHKKMLIFIGLLLFSIMAAILGFNLNILFLIVGFLATTGDEMSSASLWSWLERIDVDHSDDGIINGPIVLFEDLGWTIGPVLAGFLFDAAGPSWAILCGALPIVAVWLFAVIFLQGKPEPALAFASSAFRPLRHRHKK